MTCRSLFSTVVLTVALVPGAAWAQAPSQATTEKPPSRGAWIAIGAAAGAGAGAVFGEYVFGRGMDMPHGPDMLLGAGLGAGVGSFVAWLATRGRSGVSTDRRGLIVAPIVSPARKSVVVRYAWR